MVMAAMAAAGAAKSAAGGAAAAASPPPPPGRECVQLLRALLQKDPAGRMHDPSVIKQQPFFAAVNWALVRDGTPPFVPELRNCLDTRHFPDERHDNAKGAAGLGLSESGDDEGEAGTSSTSAHGEVDAAGVPLAAGDGSTRDRGTSFAGFEFDAGAVSQQQARHDDHWPAASRTNVASPKKK